MIDLERSLVELSERLEIPDGEHLVSDVLRRIDDQQPSRRPAMGRVPRFAVAFAVVLAIVIVVLPGPRRAVGRWLGFDSVRIEPGVTVPTTAPPTTLSVTSTTVDAPGPSPALGLGPAVSIAEAVSATGLPDAAPALLGEPLSVHVVRPPDSGQIVMVYAPSDLLPESEVTGVGALVSVLPVQIEEGYFRKTLGDAQVRPVDVGEIDGYWIEGEPHQLMFADGNDVLEDTMRLATNTLLWQRDGHVLRLEADISLETALQIAESVP